MLLTDLRYALRSLRRSPGFVAVATLSLALALGLTTVTFGILDAVKHPYVAYRETERLFEVMPLGTGASGRVSTFEKYFVLRDAASFHDGVAAYSVRPGMVLTGQVAESRSVAWVSPGFFPLLGVSPLLGRTFEPDPGTSTGDWSAQGAVISDQFWRRRFPGFSSLEGATVTVDDRTYPVIGVMPRGMSFPWGVTHVWLSMAEPSEITATQMRWVRPVIRLKPTDTPASVKPQLEVLAARLTGEYGVGIRPFRYALRSIRPDPLRFQGFHVAMGGAALAVLLIACANLANLTLARALARRREFALRMALGAGRGAIIRHVLVECLLIALVGGALGMLLSVWGMDLVANRMPPHVAFVGILEPRLSWRVFAFALAAAAATAVLFGLAPAISASDVAVNEPLKDGAGTTTGRARQRYSGLVVAEVALTMMLLMGAGLLAKAAQRMNGFEFGYDPRHLLATDVNLKQAPRGTDGARVVADLLERARRIDGGRAAATMSWDAPNGNHVTSEFAGGGGRQLFLRYFAVVSPDFLRTVGIPIVEGRDFLDEDAATSGAVIVDRAAARELWPQGGAVGRMIKLGDQDTDGSWLPVVGIARDAALDFPSDPDLAPEPKLYVVRGGDDAPWRRVIVRSAGADAAVSMALQQEVRLAMPWSPRRPVTPWLRFFEQMVDFREFMAGLFGLFGLFSLVLAAVGLYGVLSYSVSQRMREFAVRIALGARRRDLLVLVLRDGLAMVLAGTAIGAFLSMAFAQLLGTWLYSVDPTDAAALVSAEATLFVVALVACVAPALRAMQADPLAVLRAT